MIAAWMLYSLAVGALIGAAALGGERCCRVLRLPVRWVWVSGIAATLLLSCVALVRVASADRASSRVATLEAFVVGEEAASGDGRAAFAAITALVRTARESAAAAADRVYANVAQRTGAGRGLAIAWSVCTGALMLLLTVTLLRVRRARAGWRRHRIGDVPVLISQDAGPALVGLLRPSIVVPAWLLAEPAERQRLVVVHEDEHRRAGDHAVLACACVAVCLLPWNLALWWLLLRTRLAVELDCDARVLRRGAAARSYGTLLLDIAGRARARPFGAPALADTRTHLERRLLAMTETNRTPGRTRAAAAGLCALLLGVAACTADLPTAAAIEDMDVGAAEAQAQYAGVLVPTPADGAPLFMVDGVVVTEAEARALAPDEIASIEIVKGPGAVAAHGARAEHGVVRVATLARTAAPASAKLAEVPLGVPLQEPAGVMLRQQARERAPLSLRVPSEPVTLRRKSDGPIIMADGALAPNDPIVFVDGVKAYGSFSLRTLAPESIERVEVLKGAAALRLYDDPRAVNGVILITTKKAAR